MHTVGWAALAYCAYWGSLEGWRGCTVQEKGTKAHSGNACASSRAAACSMGLGSKHACMPGTGCRLKHRHGLEVGWMEVDGLAQGAGVRDQKPEKEKKCYYSKITETDMYQAHVRAHTQQRNACIIHPCSKSPSCSQLSRPKNLHNANTSP